MKRDKFEELLHDKLAGTEVTPPADLWARLEGQLPEVRRQLMLGDADLQPQSAEALPAPSIRRPLRRRMQWAYVAASVAVAAVMIFSIPKLDEPGMVAEGPGDTGSQVSLPVTVQPEVAITDGDPVAVPLTTPRLMASATTGRTASTPAAPDDTAGQGITTGPSEGTEVPGSTLSANGDQAEAPSAAPGGSVEKQETQKDTDKTSDTKRQEEFAAFMARAIADDGARTRRTTPVALSMYASNTTGMTGNGTVTGRVKLQKSPLVVTEINDFTDEETASTGSQIPLSDLSLKHDLPLSFGASVNIALARRLSLETGLTYTYMRSKGETSNVGAEAITIQKLHYLGLPVKVKYDFFQSRFIDLYAGGGFSVEKLLSGKRTYDVYYDGVKASSESSKVKVGSLQTSVGANVGLNFNIDKTFGLYVEPGVGYFFENGNQPESYRTEHPFNFTIKAGFRINL